MEDKNLIEEKTFPFEIKSLTEEGTFEGYAAIFDKPDRLNEVIEKGAFTKSLKETKQFPLLWYHDPRNPIGVCTVEEDQKGLKVIGELNLDVQAAKEKYALMKQKAIRGLSFGFNTIKDLWDGNLRRLKEIKLFEISPCTFQAHPKALISNVKQEDIDSKPLTIKGAIDFLEEFKETISKSSHSPEGEKNIDSELKLINDATMALKALLKESEPAAVTQDDKKGLIPESIGSMGHDEKSQSHFLSEITIPKS